MCLINCQDAAQLSNASRSVHPLISQQTKVVAKRVERQKYNELAQFLQPVQIDDPRLGEKLIDVENFVRLTWK